MHNYLTTVTADYNYTLVLRNQQVMPQSGDKTQKIHKFDDGGISVTRMSDTSLFDVTIQFTVITTANSAILLDLWHNTSKANGRANTFYWQHPVTERYYTVRFMDIMTNTYHVHHGPVLLEVEAFELKIEGNKP